MKALIKEVMYRLLTDHLKSSFYEWALLVCAALFFINVIF